MRDNKIPEIRFAGFTSDWEQHKLKKLAEVRTGKAFSSTDFSDEGEFLVVTNKNIQDETNRNISVGDRINISDEAILNNYLLSGENILVTMDGVNIGKSGKFTNEKAVLAQRVGRINSKQLEFVYQIISSNKFISEMNKLSVGNAIKHISLKQISDYSFSAPINEEEQERIGNFLKQLDEFIDFQEQELVILKKTKQGFLQKMFPKEGESVPEFRFTDFTKGWNTCKLGEITNVITKGSTPKVKSEKGEVNFIKVENIDSDSGAISITSKVSKEEHDKYLKRSQLKHNDILFSIAGTLGRTSIVSEDVLPANTNQALAIIRLEGGNVDFIATYLKGKSVKKFIRKNPTIGAQPNLSLQQVGNLIIDYPSDQEQEKIANFFKQLDNTIALTLQEIEALKQTKKAFLQKMFI